MLRMFIAALACLAITGCGSSRAVGVEVRTVEVPTPVACVNRDEIPAEPDRVAARLTGDAEHDVSVIAESALRLRAWGGELRALLVGCTASP